MVPVSYTVKFDSSKKNKKIFLQKYGILHTFAKIIMFPYSFILGKEIIFFCEWKGYESVWGSGGHILLQE